MAQQLDKLISQHGLVLLYIVRHPAATQRQVARELRLSEAHTGLIIRDLIKQEILFAHKYGVQNVYEVNRQAYFRHPMLSHLSIGEFTEAFGAPSPS